MSQYYSKIAIIASLALVVTGVCLCCLWPEKNLPQVSERGQTSQKIHQKAKKKVRQAKKAKMPKPEEARKRGMEKEYFTVEGVPAEHQKLAQAIVAAIDDEDLEALKEKLKVARNCPCDEVRQRMVDALGWFGKDAIVELSSFLSDRNPDVARSAFNAWDSAIDQVDNESFRIEAAKIAMQLMSDKEQLMSVAAKLEAAEDRSEALRALADIADSNNEAAMNSVKEAYRFIAGEDWRGASTARVKALTISSPDTEE